MTRRRSRRVRRFVNLLRAKDLADSRYFEPLSALYDLGLPPRAATTSAQFELDELGPVAGREVLHLQCHIGTDTLSWARHGCAGRRPRLLAGVARRRRDCCAVDCWHRRGVRVRRRVDAVDALDGRHLRRGVHGDRRARLVARPGILGGGRARPAPSRRCARPGRDPSCGPRCREGRPHGDGRHARHGVPGVARTDGTYAAPDAEVPHTTDERVDDQRRAVGVLGARTQDRAAPSSRSTTCRGHARVGRCAPTSRWTSGASARTRSVVGHEPTSRRTSELGSSCRSRPPPMLDAESSAQLARRSWARACRRRPCSCETDDCRRPTTSCRRPRRRCSTTRRRSSPTASTRRSATRRATTSASNAGARVLDGAGSQGRSRSRRLSRSRTRPRPGPRGRRTSRPRRRRRPCRWCRR